jgi:hypothetical protein
MATEYCCVPETGTELIDGIRSEALVFAFHALTFVFTNGAELFSGADGRTKRVERFINGLTFEGKPEEVTELIDEDLRTLALFVG